MITQEFGAVEFVKFYQSRYSDTKQFAHVRQTLTTVTVNEEDVMMPKDTRRVIDEKFRYTFTAFPVNGTEEQFKALLLKVKPHIMRIRGCELGSVLSKNQIGFYKSADEKSQTRLETNWQNDLIAMDPQTDTPYLYGELKIEQYGRNVLVTDSEHFADVDFRPADHARALEEIAKQKAEAKGIIDEDAPAFSEEAVIGVEDVLSKLADA